MHKGLKWALNIYYVLGSLSLIGSYISTAHFEAYLLYYFNNLMIVEAESISPKEIRSLNASAIIGMIINVSSVGLMVATAI
jgi:hypothetical protein